MTDKYIAFRTYTEWFLVFCFIGWLYESVWVSMVEQNKGFINRGFLFGPWLPIYGFGMFLVLAVLKKWNITNPWAVFAVGTLVSATAELIGSYLSEAITGHQLWSYEGYFMNFQGRIALKPDLMFGFLILAGMRLVFPKVVNLQETYKNSRTHDVFFLVILLLFAVDLFARIKLGSNFTE